MAQMKVWTWTNPAAAVARNEDVGFTVASITTTDVTNGKSYYWDSSMTNGYYQTVDTGAITTSNGFTPITSAGSLLGPSTSGFTNANPGVITVSSTSQYGIVAGDTIEVIVLDDQSATSLSGTYTVASVTETTITTTTNTTAYSVYVSTGIVIRTFDSLGNPVAVENQAIRGITVGTGAVGANNAFMTAVAFGKDPVV